MSASPGGGGAFTAIGASPSGAMFCGSDLGGAYRSLDRGQSWEAIGPSRGLTAVHVSALGFDPGNASIVYLGSERGVLRSADGGATFGVVSPSLYIAAIAAAPSNPYTVYAATHPSYNAKQTGLLKSADRGLTWAPVSTQLPDSLRVTKLVVRPFQPGVLFLVSGGDRFVPGGLPSLWKSVDGGATWTRLAAALGNVWDFAIDPNNPANLYLTTYAGTPGSSWSGALWKSGDGGVTWTQKSTHTGCVRIKRDEPRTLWVIDPYRDSASPESGCWWSTNGGDTWTRRSAMTSWEPGWQNLNWAYGSGAYGLAKVIGQDLSDPNTLLWASRQFVFGSFNGGASFQNLYTQSGPGGWRSRGIENVAVTAAAISEADTNRIFTGAYDLGLWRSLNGGASWETCNPAALTGTWVGHGGCATAIVPDPDRANVVFAILGQRADVATVLRSLDAGSPASWIPSSTGLPSGFVYGLSLDRTSSVNARTLFVTADGDVYKSVDDGITWNVVLPGHACRVTGVDRVDGTIVYAGGEGGLWRSLARGAPGTWSKVGPAAFEGQNPETLGEVQWEGIHAIVPDPSRRGRVHVAAFGGGRGVYRSEDMGAAWTRIRAGDYCRGIAIDPAHPETLFVTSSHAYKSGGITSGSEGVLRTTNGGQTWLGLNDGLPWPFAGPIALNPSNPNRVLVGSPGTGFWFRDARTAFDWAPVVQAPLAASVPEGEALTLAITASDANGDAILTLGASGLPAGASFAVGSGYTAGTVRWTPRYDQSGVYTVTFFAGNALSGSATTTITVLQRNQAPTAASTVTPATGNLPLAVSVNASASSDLDGSIASYTFDFGDGSAIVGPQVASQASHVYVQPGAWTLTVTVADDLGAVRSQSTPILVGPYRPGPNLCANGSFETDGGGWAAYGGGTMRRVAGGFDGASALEITGPSPAASFGVNDSPDWIRVSPAAGRAYRFSAWVRSIAGTGACRLQVTEYLGLAKLGSAKSSNAGLAPGWQPLTLDYTTAGAGTTLDFQVVDAPSAPGETFVCDNVGIHSLDSAVDVPPLAWDLPALEARIAPVPLRGSGTMTFATAQRGPIDVALYDASGRRVRTIANERNVPAGLHRFALDGRDERARALGSGVYFYRIRGQDGVAVGRFVIVR